MVGSLDRETEHSLTVVFIHVYSQHNHVRTGNRLDRERSLLCSFSHESSPDASFFIRSESCVNCTMTVKSEFLSNEHSGSGGMKGSHGNAKFEPRNTKPEVANCKWRLRTLSERETWGLFLPV